MLYINTVFLYWGVECTAKWNTVLPLAVCFVRLFSHHFVWLCHVPPFYEKNVQTEQKLTAIFSFLWASSQIMNNGSLPFLFNFSSFQLSKETGLWLFRVKKCLEYCYREEFGLVECIVKFIGLIQLKVWCRYEWPRSLRRESAASCFLGLSVRIPSRHWYLSLTIFVGCQVEVSGSDCSLDQRSPTEWALSECDREASE